MIDASENHKAAFWSKVDIKEDTASCWEWGGAKKPGGYGNVRINKRYMLAHRVAFELAHGEIPGRYLVCHVCDNPACCNPNHLMLGTHQSNAADMILKGRAKSGPCVAGSGSANGNSKLSEGMVEAIRRNGDMPAKTLAYAYSVSVTTIRQILKRQTWRHI